MKILDPMTVVGEGLAAANLPAGRGLGEADLTASAVKTASPGVLPGRGQVRVHVLDERRVVDVQFQGLNRGCIPSNVWDRQLAHFSDEALSLQAHHVQARERLEVLPPETRILVMDLGGDLAFDEAQVQDPLLLNLVRTHQFGGGAFTYGNALRTMMGFGLDDPRVVVWNAFADPSRRFDLGEFDFVLGSGGGAMPSELGTDSVNAPMLAAAKEVIESVPTADVPALLICLSHQLWHVAHGVEVTRVRDQREFGTHRQFVWPREAHALRLFKGVIGENTTSVPMNCSHSYSARRLPDYRGAIPLFGNGYCALQGAAFPSRSGEDFLWADRMLRLVITLQNHPDLLSLYLHLLRLVRWDGMAREGLDPSQMVFANTPEVRGVFLNILDIAGEHARRRLSRLDPIP